MILSSRTISQRLAAHGTAHAGGAAVLIPLLPRQDGCHEVLLEVRASTLAAQPGEVCLPGGHVESGETPRQAAVRETCEELAIGEVDVRVIGTLGNLAGPGGLPLWAFVGTVSGYAGTFSPDEVDRTFSIPLDWLLSHEPTTFAVSLEHRFPEDFPWDRIPGGRAYPWHAQTHEVPFYLDTDPLVWGVTARVLHRLSQVLRDSAPDA